MGCASTESRITSSSSGCCLGLRLACHAAEVGGNGEEGRGGGKEKWEGWRGRRGGRGGGKEKWEGSGGVGEGKWEGSGGVERKERWEGRGGVGRKGREESEGKVKVKGRENRSVIEWLNGFVL